MKLYSRLSIIPMTVCLVLLAAAGVAAPVTLLDTGQRIGLENSRSVVLADFDLNGTLDALVAVGTTPGGYALKRWRNPGNGQLLDNGISGDSLVVAANDIAVGDVNGDGRPDAIVATSGANRVWVNNGAGTLVRSNQSLGTANTAAVAFGRLDTNASLDAVFANSANGSSEVWTNNGLGTFTLKQSLPASGTVDVALAPLDGDSDLDIYLVSSGGNDVIFMNNGLATFTAVTPVSDTVRHRRVALADIDDDGDFDAIVATVRTVAAGSIDHRVKVFKNNGSAVFTAFGSEIAIADASIEELLAADFDGDADIDIMVIGGTYAGVGGTIRGGHSRLLLNNGAGTLSDSGQRFGGDSALDAALGDTDGDGDIDVYIAKPNLTGRGNQADHVWRSTGQFIANLWRNAQHGGFGNDFLFDVAFDASGNIAAAGAIQGAPNHGTNGYLMKVDPTGANILWSKELDNGASIPASTTADEFSGVSVDTQNRVLVTGGLASPTFSANQKRGVVRQYSPTGTQLWEQFFAEGLELSYGVDVATDAQNNVWVAGTVFTDNTIQGRWAVYKYNSAGVLQAGFPIYYNNSAFTFIRDEPARIAIDKDNNAIVVGQKGVGGTLNSPTNNMDWHVRKYNSAGVLLWQDSFGGAANLIDRAQGVTTDAAGNIYVVGDVNFGTNNTTDVVSRAVIIKYSPAGVGGVGQRLWTYTHPLTGNHGSSAYQVVMSPDGHPLVAMGQIDGFGNTRISLLSLNASTGAKREQRTFEPEGFVFPFALAARADVVAIAGSENRGPGYDMLLMLANYTPAAPVITTNGGANFTSNKISETIAGTRASNASSVFLNGYTQVPLGSGTQWSANVTLGPGQNVLNFTSFNARGVEGAADSIVITRGNAVEEAWVLYP